MLLLYFKRKLLTPVLANGGEQTLELDVEYYTVKNGVYSEFDVMSKEW